MISILQGKEKYCYITGETENLEKHHIYFGSRRKTSDKYGFWVWLTPEMHRGTNGVHGKNGHEIDIFLKTECQKKFEETNDRCEQYKAWNERHQETREQIRRAKMKDIEAYRRKKCAVEKYQRSGRH